MIVDFVGDIVDDGGFDGAHINAETVRNGDAGYLTLLGELRARLGAGRVLSIAGSHWVPDVLNAIPVVNDLRWTSAYYQAVGGYADQIAVMTYDSYSPHGAVYRFWVREQVKAIGRIPERYPDGVACRCLCLPRGHALSPT